MSAGKIVLLSTDGDKLRGLSSPQQELWLQMLWQRVEFNILWETTSDWVYITAFSSTRNAGKVLNVAIVEPFVADVEEIVTSQDSYSSDVSLDTGTRGRHSPTLPATQPVRCQTTTRRHCLHSSDSTLDTDGSTALCAATLPAHICSGETPQLPYRALSVRCLPIEGANYSIWALWELMQDEDAVFGSSTDAADISETSLVSCRLDLIDSIRNRSELEVSVLLRAVVLVAVSFRLLSVTELFDAVTTAIETPSECADIRSRDGWLESSGDLMNLCAHVLTTRDDGCVDFARDPMRRFLFDSSLLDRRGCHATVTKVCFVHLRQQEQRFPTSPWTNFCKSLIEVAKRPFLRYAMKYWHGHYREGETPENSLPRELYEMVKIAIISELEEDGLLEDRHLAIEVYRITLATTLRLSRWYRFRVLESLCLRRGAEESESSLRSTGLIYNLNIQVPDWMTALSTSGQRDWSFSHICGEVHVNGAGSMQLTPQSRKKDWHAVEEPSGAANQTSVTAASISEDTFYGGEGTATYGSTCECLTCIAGRLDHVHLDLANEAQEGHERAVHAGGALEAWSFPSVERTKAEHQPFSAQLSSEKSKICTVQQQDLYPGLDEWEWIERENG